MHFSIPNTKELSDASGSHYTAFNVHINGVYHCSVRYQKFYDFQQELKKEFGSVTSLPYFPPKKLFPLSPFQVDERRLELERFIQNVSQIPEISNSETFNHFLLTAQQQSQLELPSDIDLDVFLVNGHEVTVNIKSMDKTNDVLECVASKIGLPLQFLYYFGLYLVCKDPNADFTIVRKLQEFESPFISLKSLSSSGMHWITVRKSYWDSSYDDDLMEDRVAMNLLFLQAVSDVERGWILTSDEEASHLSALLKRGSKKEYLRSVRGFQYYGYVVFKPCTSDYPQPDTKVIVATGNKELNFRILHKSEVREVSFKVTRMRCWRISSVVAEDNGRESSEPCRLELSFEYLVAKNSLRWITLYTSQAILISMCLQGMVDELIMKNEGRKIMRTHDGEHSNFQLPSPTSSTNSSARHGAVTSPTTPTAAGPSSLVIQVTHTPPAGARALSRFPFGGDVPANTVSNNVFDGIQDDDL